MVNYHSPALDGTLFPFPVSFFIRFYYIYGIINTFGLTCKPKYFTVKLNKSMI
jgi:hypothetical protein